MGVTTCCSIVPRRRAREKTLASLNLSRQLSATPSLAAFRSPSARPAESSYSLISSHPPPSMRAPPPTVHTRDTSRISSYATAPRSRASIAGLASQQDTALVVGEIWEEAYNELKNDEALRHLVRNYEGLFEDITHRRGSSSRRSSHCEKWPDGDGAGDGDRHPADEEYFQTVARGYMEVTRRDTAHQPIIASAIQFIQRTKDAVGLALTTSPPASLAWTGICTIILPVSEPRHHHLPLPEILMVPGHCQSRRADRCQGNRVCLRLVEVYMVHPSSRPPEPRPLERSTSKLSRPSTSHPGRNRLTLQTPDRVSTAHLLHLLPTPDHHVARRAEAGRLGEHGFGNQRI